MKISLFQPPYRGSIWIYIESESVCIKISTSTMFDPYEDIYLWLLQIQDSVLPVSVVIDEEGHGVELIAETVDNEQVLFRIEPCLGREDATTFLVTTLKPRELVQAFYNGITAFIDNGYRPSDWTFTDSLRTIPWHRLIDPNSPKCNWQMRQSLKHLSVWNDEIQSDLYDEDETLPAHFSDDQQWLIVLRDVLEQITIMAVRHEVPSIQSLANLYRSLATDLILGEVDPSWYRERNNTLSKEFGLESWQSSQEGREHRRTLGEARFKTLKIGQLVDGVIKRIYPDATVLVEIAALTALLDAKQISQRPILDIYQVFHCGDWLRAVIIDLDAKRLRILLSTSLLEVEPGDMLLHPWKVYETAEIMVEKYRQNINGQKLTQNDIIASRNLDVLDSAGRVVSTATVVIGKPEQVGEYEWSCAYTIIGLGDESTYRVSGLDAIQVIQCAFTVIDGVLAGTDVGAKGLLRWNNEADLGFSQS
jgi:hypothetical protein